MPPASTPDLLVVGIDRFQGPLDLLLHLIRKQDIDIFDIPISRITEQFLEAIRDIEAAELDRAGDFIEMAATLVRIKAQMLFPRGVEDDDEDPRADLVRRLLEYEHFRDAAELMERAERQRSRYHRKGFVPLRPATPNVDTPLETTWGDVQAAVLELVARLSEPEHGYRIPLRIVRIEDKIEYVLGRLRASDRLDFASLVAPWGSRMHAVVSLLACLELAKRSSLRLRQSAPFATLWVYRGGDADAA